MTFYWERCDICGRHKPTRQCWLHPERMVCAYCCIACPERNVCPHPVWFPSLRVAASRPAGRRRPGKEEARKALEELLRKLEEG